MTVSSGHGGRSRRGLSMRPLRLRRRRLPVERTTPAPSRTSAIISLDSAFRRAIRPMLAWTRGGSRAARARSRPS